MWVLQENSTDAFVGVTRDGVHWFDGGAFYELHNHTWTADHGRIWTGWYGATRGIAMALQTMEILSELDYEALGFTLAERETHLMQLRVLKASLYLNLLDLFGGVPIFNATTDRDVRRSTARETFDHIERLLLDAIPYLPRKTELGATESGSISQGGAAALLARLYFNAESYIGEPRFEDAARVSQRILDGVYGAYALGTTWYCAHTFGNNRSPEMIWIVPSANGRLTFNWFFNVFYPGNGQDFFDLRGTPGIGTAWNGWCLVPSRDPEGNLLPYRLGGPFERFHDDDLRKRPFRYLGGGRHEGMFMVGELRNPRTGAPVMGAQGLTGQPLTIVDKIARFSLENPPRNPDGSLRSTVLDGEENTGIRLVKTPIPNVVDQNLLWEAGQPFIRLTEIYFILAETKMRAGDLDGAAALINTVRARNFAGADPDPVTAANLDSYRMLDEWLIEFLGEGRRRTDLIRWDKFVTRPWWDFEPHGNRTRHRFPIPQRAINASGPELLPQNPGY